MPDPATATHSDRSLGESFLAHWRGLAHGGGIPTLSSFLDHCEPRFAPWTMIVDVDSTDRFPLRLVGTRLTDMFGEHTGDDFLSIMPPSVRAVVVPAHRQICTRPCGWRTEGTVVINTGRETVAQLTNLPLVHRGSASCVVKLVSVIDRLDFREAVVRVLDIRFSRWIDLGAGVPA